jgi:hypothetical protein
MSVQDQTIHHEDAKNTKKNKSEAASAVSARCHSRVSQPTAVDMTDKGKTYAAKVAKATPSADPFRSLLRVLRAFVVNPVPCSSTHE